MLVNEHPSYQSPRSLQTLIRTIFRLDYSSLNARPTHSELYTGIIFCHFLDPSTNTQLRYGGQLLQSTSKFSITSQTTRGARSSKRRTLLFPHDSDPLNFRGSSTSAASSWKSSRLSQQWNQRSKLPLRADSPRRQTLRDRHDRTILPPSTTVYPRRGQRLPVKGTPPILSVRGALAQRGFALFTRLRRYTRLLRASTHFPAPPNSCTKSRSLPAGAKERLSLPFLLLSIGRGMRFVLSKHVRQNPRFVAVLFMQSLDHASLWTTLQLQVRLRDRRRRWRFSNAPEISVRWLQAAAAAASCKSSAKGRGGLIPGNLLRATSRTILHPVGDGEHTLRGRCCCGGLERAARLGRLRCSVTSDQIAHLVAQEADTYYHERFHRIDYRFPPRQGTD